MEKTAQNPSGAPRRRRRRRGSGTGASQNAQAQASAAREGGKAAQPAAKEKAPRQQPPRKENKEAAPATPAPRGRHRGAQQAEPAAPAQPSGRRSRGNGGSNSSQQAPAREQNHSPKPSTRAARAQRRAAEEDPGLELITRRPPKQKFANFEEYLAAHGGMTVPLPDDGPATAGQAADGAAE